jgi:replicative DNA helicase
MNYQMIMREPPREQTLVNIEGEAALLGALMYRNSAVDVIADRIDVEDFAEHIHARIYHAILTATSVGASATPVTLRPLFDADPAFETVGGAGYLAVLTGNGAIGTIDVKSLADQIADLAARRRLVLALNSAQASVYDPDKTLATLVEEADAGLVASIEKREVWAQPSAADAIGEALARIEQIKANQGKVGATTGICDIDDLLGGFEPGQVVIVAGRPGMGKTAVACSMALGLARQKHGVLFVSLEMKAMELGMRMASDLCFNGRRGVEFNKIVRATVDNEEFRSLARAKDLITDWPLRIVDAGAVTMARLALGVRRHKRRMAAAGHELKVVMIDYLQLLSADTTRHQSANDRVAEISRGLKYMAKDLGVAVVALAQLNRGVEGRDDKRPQLSDLRDSGQIEQDADAVMFLYREEYYLRMGKPKRDDLLPDWERKMADSASRIDFLCRKVRNGRVGDRTGYYFAHYQAVRGSDLNEVSCGE